MYTIEQLDLPALHSVQGRLQLPGSKSISNRVLLLAALADGTTEIDGLLDSDDTRVMQDALRALGCSISAQGTRTIVQGMSDDLRVRQAELLLGNAGTAMRPLAAVLSVLGGDYVLDGVARMRERPIGDLVDTLRTLGCEIEYTGTPGFPPLRIGQPRLGLDRPVVVNGAVSSQFLTALLIALPLASEATGGQPIVIEVRDRLISQPYVAMTLELMQRFGVTVTNQGFQRFEIPAGCRYHSPGRLQVEPDASNASYFIAAAALSADGAAGLTIAGLGRDSIQGDIRFVEAAQRMGARVDADAGGLRIRPGAWPLRAIDLDCTEIPDAAMTLAMMALYADAPSTLWGIASWRVKETDRLAAMATELRRLGAAVEEGPDRLRITPIAPGQWHAATLCTYDDHRMAMCAALAAFNRDGLPQRILDPACVAKTFPDYFETLFSVAESSQPPPVICVDGPSASGKGTLARALADRLGYHYLDSGALYRLAGLAARRHQLAMEPANAAAIVALLQRSPPRFEQGQIWLDDEEVSTSIRTEAASADASRLSAWPEIRAALLDLQRSAARLPGLVADGRDMGTIVFPHAALKVFLVADAAVRATRRHAQLLAGGISAKIDALRADLDARDARDRSRTASPLKRADDALLLDNSQLSVEQSTQQVLDWWQARQPF